MEIVKRPPPPRGLRRVLFRLPIWLYRLRLGWLLGHRFLFLTHVGRVSGKRRRVVVEVVGHDPARRTYTVASGFGPRAHWYRNALANPDVTIQVGRATLPVTATPLPAGEAEAVMAGYARRHPAAARRLAAFMGFTVDGSEADYRSMAHHIPFLRFTPR